MGATLGRHGACPSDQHARVTSDGFTELLVSAALWTVAWVLLFYVIAFCVHRCSYPPSTKQHENDKYWIARDVFGIIHAIFVSVLAVPAAITLLGAPDWVQFGSSDHLAQCRVDPANKELMPWNFVGQAVALSGMAFTTFTLADVVVLAVHGMATVDFVLHHVAFVTAGMIIRGHCMLPFNAAVLMAMEVSTPFLNYFQLVRHRGDAFKGSATVSGTLFFVLYLFWRIGLNLYATIHLWIIQLEGHAVPAHVPPWQAWFLLIAVTLGAGVQFAWMPGICRLFASRLAALRSERSEEQDYASLEEPSEE